jgi:multiple sugar transport system permease protein
MAATIPVDAVPGGAAGSSARVGRRSFLDRFGGAMVLLVLLPLAVLWLAPFYLMVRNALMTQAEISSFEWAWWPAAPQWSNFRLLFEDPSAPMGTGLRNSALIALANLVFQTLFASMAGYALARLPVRGRDAVLYLILGTVMVPAAVTFVPTFVVVAQLGGVNTLWGLIVPTLFSAFSTFLFRQYYLDFPQEIEEAGRLDGLSYLGVYRELMLPNSKGILAALGVLSFIYSWNAFLWPLVIGQNPSSWTTQIVLSTFLTAQTINVPMLFAGAVVGALPLVVAFLFLQRFIVEGVRLSGVKG